MMTWIKKKIKKSKIEIKKNNYVINISPKLNKKLWKIKENN